MQCVKTTTVGHNRAERALPRQMFAGVYKHQTVFHMTAKTVETEQNLSAIFFTSTYSIYPGKG